MIVIVSLLLAADGIFGWFIKGEKNKLGATAAINKSYYESGDGLSPETAFEIARPMQLYYFAWLQNLGYYNVAENDQAAIASGRMPAPVYFKVSNDLDMAGFILPSIGTSDYPFVGVFDGGGHSVNGLTVSNTTDYGAITYPPSGSDGVVGFQIVGFFGVIGKLKNVSVTYNASAACVKNLVLDGITVKSEDPHNDSSLIGVAAGYVNGEISGVTVINANVSVSGGIVPLSEYSTNYSDFTLVGHCENDCLSALNLCFVETAAPYVDPAYIPGSVGAGGGDSWGGSIDMKALNLRLFNLLNSGNVTYSSRKYFGYYSDSDHNISVGRGGTNIQNYFARNPTATRVFYNLLGNGLHSYYSQNFTMPGTSIPLLVDDDYKTIGKNTGYIVSDTENLSGISGTIRSSSYETRFISNSLDDVNKTRSQVLLGTGTTFPSYDKTKLEILTNFGSTYSPYNFVLVKDEMDGFNGDHTPTQSSAVYGYRKDAGTTPTALGLGKYNSSRLSIDSVLSGEDFIHGIHFVGSSISINKTLTINNALINGTVFPTYELPKSSVNFKVKESGHINFFGGSYYAQGSFGSWADSFFSLHEVTRSGSNISSINEIKYIYENTNYDPNVLGSKKYVYQYAGGSVPQNAGALIFDMRFLTEQPPVDNALYYFEIPVNEGEYALGTVSGKSGGGYLMYLDISATSVEADGVKTVETTSFLKYKYEYPSGVGLSGDGTVPPAVLAETISVTGEKIINIYSAQTDSFTELLIRNASSVQITPGAAAVKLLGIEERVERRETIIETVNGDVSVYVIITVTIYNKDADGNVLSVVTTCSATKDGEPIPVPSGYGGAVTKPSETPIFKFRYVDNGGAVTVSSVYTEGGDNDGTYAFTVVSEDDLTLFVSVKSPDYCFTVNDEEVNEGDEIPIGAT